MAKMKSLSNNGDRVSAGQMVPYHTEAQVLAAIDKCVNRLAEGFIFGSCTLDDIKQQGRLFAIEALGRYETGNIVDGVPQRKLENFLFIHIKNRLGNYVRDNYARMDPPCLLCHNGEHRKHEDKVVCEKYRKWTYMQSRRKDLTACTNNGPSAAGEQTHILKEHDEFTESAINSKDIDDLMRAKLPENLLTPYLDMRQGLKIKKSQRRKVLEAAKEILVDYADEHDGCFPA